MVIDQVSVLPRISQDYNSRYISEGSAHEVSAFEFFCFFFYYYLCEAWALCKLLAWSRIVLVRYVPFMWRKERAMKRWYGDNKNSTERNKHQTTIAFKTWKVYVWFSFLCASSNALTLFWIRIVHRSHPETTYIVCNLSAISQCINTLLFALRSIVFYVVFFIFILLVLVFSLPSHLLSLYRSAHLFSVFLYTFHYSLTISIVEVFILFMLIYSILFSSSLSNSIRISVSIALHFSVFHFFLYFISNLDS